MATLIDGYNLLHAAGLGRARYGPGGLEKARRALLGALSAALGTEAEQTTIVFDAAGAPPNVPQHYNYKGIDVRFAANHADADALMEELIEADSAPRRLSVVSSDRRIQRAARRRRARALGSEQYLIELHRRRARARPPRRVQRNEPSAKHRGSLSPAELDFWLEEFQIDRELDDPPDHAMPEVVPLKQDVRKRGRKRK